MKPYTNPLVLASPYMRGQRVKDAQWLLSGHSRFDGLAPYKDGKIDGQYGPTTAQATKRAKFWLGYPTSHCDKVFGQTLYEYLRQESWRPLPPDYRRRREFRLREAESTPGLAALEYARTQLGYHESPWGSNHQKYGQWYGFDYVPWCAIFESYCFAHSTKPFKFRYAAVINISTDARAGRNGLRIVYTPKPGDVACYGSKHTAFFEKHLGGGYFQDLGGNTGPSSMSNGGAVMRGRRSYSSVTHWVRAG